MRYPFCPRRGTASVWLFLSLLSAIAPDAEASRVIALTGLSGDAGFGVSVSTPGDLNGDGYSDVSIGATTFEYEGEAVPGRVYIYFGGPGLDAAADLVLTGEAPGDRFGYVHDGAGDLNADGHPDLLVGAYQNDGNGFNSGRAYIFFGGPTLDATPDLVLTGLQAGEQFGVSLAGVGDVNADGYADILVGARFNTAGGSEAGRAYVYFGGPTLDAVPDLTLNSQTPLEQMGFAVTGGMDVNGDGQSDFVVGAYHNPTLDFETGRAYVYFGGPGVDANPDLVLEGEGYRAHFADALGMADANGDGRGDILVGASQYNGATGRAYVYFGGPGLDASADLVLQAGGIGDWFGRFVSGGGDLDRDGFADLLVGAPALNSGGPGRAYLFRGGPAVDSSFDAAYDGEAFGDAFGWNGAAGARDLDADGVADFVVGGFRNDQAGDDVGRAYLFLSASNRPPDCAAAAATVPELWPPNHDLVSVGISGVTDPDGDATTVQITGISSDEPTRNRRGDPCPDAFNDGAAARLRAERSESGNGRVYTLRFEATDPAGAKCSGTASVCVPIRTSSACIDGGATVDATMCTSGGKPSRDLTASSMGSGLDISFTVDSGGPVRLEAYDVRGRLVRVVTAGDYPSGSHSVSWDGRGSSGALAPAGIYMLRLTAGSSTRNIRVVLVR